MDSVLELEPLREQVADSLVVFNDLSHRLATRTQEEEFARQQLEMWEFQLRELEEAQLDPAEESQLVEKLALGRNSRSLLECAAQARQILTEGETNTSQLLGSAIAALGPVSGASPRLEAIISQLQEAQVVADEAGSDLERFLDSVDVDPSQLDELEERHSLYASLKRKYDRDVDDLMDLLGSLRERVERQKSAASDLETLAAELEKARSALAETAGHLRRQRLAGCKKVASRARDLLRPLALPELDLVFDVGVRQDPDGQVQMDGVQCLITGNGGDKVSLLVRTNRGEAFGEVGKIASGGEKSRIYLGLSVLAETGPDQPLLLFDEIDAGLGMDNAVPVAGLLARLSEKGQVLCITHLPTVAAHGKQHLKVSKAISGGRTTLTVGALSPAKRVEEIARLLGGQMSGSQAALSQMDYARQLLGAEFQQGRG